MIKYYLVLSSWAISQITTSAQDIEEGTMDMSRGVNNGFSLELPDYDHKFATLIWRNYIKGFKGKTKKVKRSTELFTDDADISYLSTSAVALYCKIDRAGNGSSISVWIDMGGAFIDSENHGDATEGVELLLQGFQKELNVEQVKRELAAEQKELKSLENKLRKLRSLNERYHKEIENWKKKIADNEEKITTNNSDQSEMESTIESQKAKVKDVELELAKAEN